MCVCGLCRLRPVVSRGSNFLGIIILFCLLQLFSLLFNIDTWAFKVVLGGLHSQIYLTKERYYAQWVMPSNINLQWRHSPTGMPTGYSYLEIPCYRRYSYLEIPCYRRFSQSTRGCVKLTIKSKKMMHPFYRAGSRRHGLIHIWQRFSTD